MNSMIRHTFDAAGRRTKTSFKSPDSLPIIPGDTIRNFYNALGQLDSAKNTTYKVRRTYYLNGLLRSEIQSLANGTAASTHFYYYDAAGRRTKYAIGGPVADTVSYSYHTTTGNLTNIAVRWRNGQTNQVNFVFDVLGRRKQLTYSSSPHNLVVNLAYDANGNMVRLCSQGGLGGNLDTYLGKTDIDLDDNVKSISRLGDAACNDVSSSGGDIFEYDSRHQITQHGSTSYEYDASGNRTRVNNGVTDMIHEMTAGSNQLSVVRYPGQTVYQQYDYNDAGARIAEGVVTYARLYFYDALGRTSGILQQSGGTYAGSQVSCTYDPLGKVVQPCEGGTTTTITLGYDGPNTVRTQPDGTASGGWTFVHGPGLDDPLVGMLNSASSSGQVAFYVTDGAGRQYAVADKHGYSIGSGGTVGHHRYAGAITSSESFDSQRQATGTSPGLSLFRNRLYDQATGRWTQEDPLGVAGGVNLYQYNGNNPVTFTDPFGLSPEAKDEAACLPCAAAARIAMVGLRAAPAAAAVVASSRLLSVAIRAEGVSRRAGHAAHHIVAGSARGAAAARQVLTNFQININDAANGVFLPGSRAAQAMSGGAYHPGLHTNRYYQAVNESLQRATTRQEALEVLRYIGTQLQQNTFPK
jgi:RHS repeat-associated protein